MVAYFQVVLMLTSTDPKCTFNDFPILKFPDNLFTNALISNWKVYAVFFHCYITGNSNMFYIISCPNKYKTFWYKISGSKMFQFTKCCYYVVSLFLNPHWKHFSLASPVLQWFFFSAPVVIRLIKLHVLYCWTGT